MQSSFRKPLVRAFALVGTFAFVAVLGSTTPAAGGTDKGPRAFHIEAAGAAYRLELEGTLAATTGPFEARLFRLPTTVDATRKALTTETPPIVVSPIPYDPTAATLDGPPDAVWTATPNGTTTLVAIEVGPDRVEGALVTRDAAKTVACWPEDPPLPLWVEINGARLDMSTALTHVQLDLSLPEKSAPRADQERVPLAEPRRFFREFAKLHGLVLAAMAPPVSDVEQWAKSPCMRECIGCANGILRVTGLMGATVLACSSVGVTGGTSAGACVIAMLMAHASALDAGIQCAGCDSCRRSHRDSSDPPCDCPCTGEPTCHCQNECSSGSGSDGSLPDL